MRILLAIILAAALGWSGYWYWGQRSVENSLENWFAARQAEGWLVEVGGIETIGFPNRFDTTLSELELADPETGWAWSAPFLKIFALSYRPNHIIVAWPDTQSVATPLQTTTVTSDNMRGSVKFRPGIALELDHATIEFDNVGLMSTLDWQMSAKSGQLAVRRTPVSDAYSYDFAINTQEVVLPSRLSDMVRQDGESRFGTLDLRATVVFDAPWDRSSIEERRPQPTKIEIDNIEASLDQLKLRLAGDLDIDENGTPSGEIAIKAENWREILALAEAAGAVPQAFAPMLESALQMVARMSGNPDTIDVPLTFRDGRISLAGIVPLGPTPVMRLR